MIKLTNAFTEVYTFRLLLIVQCGNKLAHWLATLSSIIFICELKDSVRFNVQYGSVVTAATVQYCILYRSNKGADALIKK
jgi:hypothetical protein